MNAAATAAAAANLPVPARRVGRFELQRALGHGAQASVWLAFDPRLQRQVALKLLAHADAHAVEQWMREARAASRLSHPHIVPLFEADDREGPPHLVFEYVPGGTVGALLRRDGRLAPRRAAELMAGVLDALAAAHAQGIVHRDLKPSNVLLDADGRARVMDFGIAARIADDAQAHIVGTPGYISPEAARGEVPAPAMDVFSAGAMLAELITGTRLLAERDPRRALQRVQREDLELPRDADVDDTLRGIVQRALARDPQRRFGSAAAMRDALAAWLQPSAAPAEAAVGHGTLEFLLRRMRHKSDFPALGEAVLRIQRSASSESESLSGLAAEVLRDVALTNKLLRLVNGAGFAHAGGGGIATVSRAVALIGFGGVRNLALSLVLLEHMRNQQHAAELKEDFLRALMAGTLAGELASLSRESEEVFIGALFQNLGRLLTSYYFPEEAQQIRRLREQGVEIEQAAQRVLGLGLQELGIGVARSWGLPEHLQRTMWLPEGEPPPRGSEGGVERVRWIGRCANEISECLLRHGAEASQQAIGALAARYARTLDCAPGAIVGAAARARERLTDFARTMGVDVARGSAARRLFPEDATLSPSADDAAAKGAAAAAAAAGPRERSAAVTEALTAGIADITQRLAGDEFNLNEVLQEVLSTMHGALALQRVVLCLRDARTDTVVGRLAMGVGGMQACKPFVIPLREQPGAPVDLFAAVCRKGVDTVIADTTRGDMASRLPAWYRESVNAPSFLLLPLMLRRAPLGLLYADAAVPGALALHEKELALLRTLRNQVVMAFRQSGG
ncbi:MAG: serine/threonine protein kinase [Rubrivivax sp. SCN 71-131]|jgi:HD-like signal output (HDOD) protein|nr:MAG: serine/threonine protein kinase [Rubrivivax sp. SCN 71-131]